MRLYNLMREEHLDVGCRVLEDDGGEEHQREDFPCFVEDRGWVELLKMKFS